jgi:hypothetical protein
MSVCVVREIGMELCHLSCQERCVVASCHCQTQASMNIELNWIDDQGITRRQQVWKLNFGCRCAAFPLQLSRRPRGPSPTVYKEQTQRLKFRKKHAQNMLFLPIWAFPPIFQICTNRRKLYSTNVVAHCWRRIRRIVPRPGKRASQTKAQHHRESVVSKWW